MESIDNVISTMYWGKSKSEAYFCATRIVRAIKEIKPDITFGQICPFVNNFCNYQNLDDDDKDQLIDYVAEHLANGVDGISLIEDAKAELRNDPWRPPSPIGYPDTQELRDVHGLIANLAIIKNGCSDFGSFRSQSLFIGRTVLSKALGITSGTANRKINILRDAGYLRLKEYGIIWNPNYDPSNPKSSRRLPKSERRTNEYIYYRYPDDNPDYDPSNPKLNRKFPSERNPETLVDRKIDHYTPYTSSTEQHSPKCVRQSGNPEAIKNEIIPDCDPATSDLVVGVATLPGTALGNPDEVINMFVNAKPEARKPKTENRNRFLEGKSKGKTSLARKRGLSKQSGACYGCGDTVSYMARPGEAESAVICEACKVKSETSKAERFEAAIQTHHKRSVQARTPVNEKRRQTAVIIADHSGNSQGNRTIDYVAGLIQAHTIKAVTTEFRKALRDRGVRNPIGALGHRLKNPAGLHAA